MFIDYLEFKDFNVMNEKSSALLVILNEVKNGPTGRAASPTSAHQHSEARPLTCAGLPSADKYSLETAASAKVYPTPVGIP